MYIRIKQAQLRFILIGFMLFSPFYFSQAEKATQIKGKLLLNDAWDSKVYISLIPSFSDMYFMSEEMIIASTDIDSSGNFEFEMDFLPKGENLYRFHVSKKGDDRATLIIGGREENHCFFVIDHPTQFEVFNSSSEPPFRNVKYKGSSENKAFRLLSNIIFVADSIRAESSATKRALIQEQFIADLTKISDTSSNFLVALYAIHQLPLQKTMESDQAIYDSFLNKWNMSGNTYLEEFQGKLPKRSDNHLDWIFVFVGIVLISMAIILGFRNRKPKVRLNTLSIQERKVFELLQEGLSNQEIADQLNVGLSTVKSQVSSIFSKLKLKSRKEIMDIKNG